jgi:hypothetical protein
MPARPEFTLPCGATAYAPTVVMTPLMERTVEHLVVNIAVVVAFFLVLRAGMRLVDRF